MRFASFASAAALLGSLTTPALAQIPVYAPPPPPPEPASAVAAPPAATDAPAAVQPPALPVAPPAAATPASAPDLPPSANAPPPAKAEVISERPRLPRDEEDDDVPDAELGPARKWYGWQTLTADGVSLAAIVAAAGANSGSNNNSDGSAGLVIFGLLGYELAPGIIHFVHKNPGRGFASFGMRLGLPLAGAFLGASVASGCDGFLCEADGAALGLLIGMGSAIAIDAAVFAFDDAKAPPTRSARRSSLVPLFSVTPHKAWVGFGGQL